MRVCHPLFFSHAGKLAGTEFLCIRCHVLQGLGLGCANCLLDFRSIATFGAFGTDAFCFWFRAITSLWIVTAMLEDMWNAAIGSSQHMEQGTLL